MVPAGPPDKELGAALPSCCPGCGGEIEHERDAVEQWQVDIGELKPEKTPFRVSESAAASAAGNACRAATLEQVSDALGAARLPGGGPAPKITELGDLRPGKVSVQNNTCGTPGCRCKAELPHRHGPYCQLNYSRGGRNRTETVHPEHLTQVEAQTADYIEFQSLLAE